MIMDLFINILVDFSLAFVVAGCWGILFGTPLKALWMTGLLGGFGHSIRFVILQMNVGLIPATLVACLAIGLVGIYAAHKVHNPPVVLTMPASITMIPGLFAYRTMLGSIKLTDSAILEKTPNILQNIAHNAVLTFILLSTMAIGISISALLFRNKSVKEIHWGRRFFGKKE